MKTKTTQRILIGLMILSLALFACHVVLAPALAALGRLPGRGE